MKRTFILLLASLAVPLLFGLWALLRIVQVSSVEFPSSTNRTALRRNQLSFGDSLRFETWDQPGNFSYSVWVPFEAKDATGRPMRCRVEAEGWIRTQSTHRDLIGLYCICERTWLHHDRQVSCPGLK